MKFRYHKYDVDPSSTVPDGTVYRPMIPVRLVGTTDSLSVHALLDTGADETVFPLSMAEAVGVRLAEGKSLPVAGIAGQTVDTIFGEVGLELGSGRQSLRWTQTVRFAVFASPEDEVAILGQAGFLNFFTATFDGKRHEVTLKPSGMLARS